MNNLIDINTRIQYANLIRNIFLKDNKHIFTHKNFNNITILYTSKHYFNKYIINHLGTIGGSIDAEAYKLEPKNGSRMIN